MLRFPSFKLKILGMFPVYLAFLFLSFLTVLTGCTVGPDYSGPPASPAPVNWTQEESERVEPGLPALDDWWTVFDDPVLNTILVNINEQNLSLRAAAWKIYQARALLCATRGDLFPQVDMNSAYSLNKSSGEREGMAGAKLVSESWSWGLSANWEIDVFGRLRRLVEAQEAELEATEDDYRSTKMILLADAASTYISARLAQERMEIIRANINQQRQFLNIIEARFKAGKDDRLSYAQAMGNLHSMEAQYPNVVSEYQVALNRLSVLMGSPPGTVDELMKKVEPIPVATEAVAASVPADILHRRPDIRAMERRLAAQTARIGVAEADKYPRFFIMGSFGLEAAQLKDIFGPRSITASVTPSLQWNIFQFGKIRCNIMYQEGVTEQMRYEYQQLVLEAAEEVDNALARFVRLQQRVQNLEETVLQNRDALQISESLYASGRESFLPVLDSQRSVLEYEETLATARANLASTVVEIYRALGGGWQVDPEATSVSQQINRFANRNTDGRGVTSSPGEGVNQNGSVRTRQDLPSSVSRPSERVAVPALNKRDVTKMMKETPAQKTSGEEKSEVPTVVEPVIPLPAEPGTPAPSADESVDEILIPMQEDLLPPLTSASIIERKQKGNNVKTVSLRPVSQNSVKLNLYENE
ncbi:MAG: efflux transporter outer membrane subunit [Planctomycetia bacterium]|nr:efflux transporter outer membrane subunit [Planctomycetia bacterium]